MIALGIRLDRVHVVPLLAELEISISLGIIVSSLKILHHMNPEGASFTENDIRILTLSLCLEKPRPAYSHQTSHVEDHRSTPDGPAPPSCKCFQKH